MPTRKFLSFNNSISNNGTLPFLFLLSSNHANPINAIIPKIITIMLVLKSSVSDKIPNTNKTRPIIEIMAPVMSRSLIDSVGTKLGILLCNTKIRITPINSHANPYLQLRNVVMTPPKSGPTAAAIAPMTPTIANAIVRFSPS